MLFVKQGTADWYCYQSMLESKMVVLWDEDFRLGECDTSNARLLTRRWNSVGGKIKSTEQEVG